MEAAEAGLFQGPSLRPDTAIAGGTGNGSGARVSQLDSTDRLVSRDFSPDVHDRTVAFTSHLPQLASTALAATLDGLPELQTRVYGPALVDSTRLALSSFDIWGDIFDTNRRQILVALEAYIAKLEEFRAGLRRGAMRRHFDAAARLASQVRDRT